MNSVLHCIFKTGTHTHCIGFQFKVKNTSVGNINYELHLNKLRRNLTEVLFKLLEVALFSSR
jgi:hypothetical protein